MTAQTVLLSVQGMKCEGCAATISEKLGGLEELTAVCVDLAGKSVEITTSATGDGVHSAMQVLREAGFDVRIGQDDSAAIGSGRGNTP